MPSPFTFPTLTKSACILSLLAASSFAQPAATPPASPENAPAPQAPAADAPQTEFKLPGLVVNTVEKFVDVEASICLDEGALEVIACTKETKEHESIVVVAARPIHIHAALLLLGAKNGNPAMREPLDDQGTRWRDIPPRGAPIEVFLAWKDAEGKLIERPIGDFIKRNRDEGGPAVAEGDAAKEEKEKFPNTFVFAGSLLGDPSKTPRDYMAELSGHVISISAFGDEVLCLPAFYGQDNESLMWAIDPTHLPKRDSKVMLRLRPKKEEPKPEIKQAP
ncbi:MAG: YdjY domain-containing protein [Verrucomicrobiales bacterium]